VKTEITTIIAPVIKSHQERRLILGKATSLAPIWIGRKKFPNTVGMAGMTTRKIIMIPCNVKRELYVWGFIMGPPGAIISRRMKNPRTTPLKKKPMTKTR
jgi:hypothetical protein